MMLRFLLRASITLGMLTAVWTAAGGRAMAQEAPEASAASYLFVQSAGGGTLEPIAAAGQYRLSLTNVLPSVVYFSDRPVRRAGHGATQTLVDNWALGINSFAADPPNAALEILDGPASPNVIVLELHEPAYDPATQTMTYRVVLLPSSERSGLADVVSRAASAAAIPTRFGTASLFIDAGCSIVDPRC